MVTAKYKKDPLLFEVYHKYLPLALHLKIGIIYILQRKNNKKLTKDQALYKLQRYCAYQDRCHQEVRTKLIELGVYGMNLEEIITELIKENFLNEERFARSYARGKFYFQKWGKFKITRELRARKMSDYLLRKAMEEISEEDYLKTIDELVEKKNEDYYKISNLFERKQKMANFLINKGFEAGLAWERIKLWEKKKS